MELTSPVIYPLMCEKFEMNASADTKSGDCTVKSIEITPLDAHTEEALSPVDDEELWLSPPSWYSLSLRLVYLPFAGNAPLSPSATLYQSISSYSMETRATWLSASKFRVSSTSLYLARCFCSAMECSCALSVRWLAKPTCAIITPLTTIAAISTAAST